MNIDTQVFSFIYSLPHPIIVNWFFSFLSGVGKAGIIWFLFGVVLFFREEKKDHRFFIPIVGAGFLSSVAVWVLKHRIARPRPTGILDDFSFPSGHATIAWAMAVVLSRYEPRWRWAFYTLAFLISFSRIYLGVHYPFDVMGGAVLGIIIAWTSLMLGNFVRRKWTPKSPRPSKNIR